MQQLFSNSKEKILSVEDGNASENLEKVPKSKACKKFLEFVQFILIFELTFFLGWICYSIYQTQFIPYMRNEEIIQKSPLSVVHDNLKLNTESSNHLNYDSWQKESSEKTTVFENSNTITENLHTIIPVIIEEPTSENYRAKEVVEEKIENGLEEAFSANKDSNIEVSTINSYDYEMETTTLPNVKDTENGSGLEVKHQVLTNDMPSSKGFTKKYHFKFSLGSATGIEDNNNDNSQASSKERPALPFYYRIFFNVSNSENDNLSKDVDLESQNSFGKIEVPIPRDEEPLKWWVNTPEFQDTRTKFQSSEEFQNKNSEVTSDFDNDLSLEKNFVDFLFGKPNSDRVIFSDSQEVENIKSSDETNSESLDKFLNDFMSSIFSSEENDNDFSKEIDYPKTPKYTQSDLFETYKSSEEILEHALEDLIKQLNLNSENETEMQKSTALNLIIPNESTSANEETDLINYLLHSENFSNQVINDKEPIAEDLEKDLTWRSKENLYHPQHTWNEEAESKEFQTLDPQNYDYNDGLINSSDYIYD